MKKLLIFFIALIALLAGCNQSASVSPEEITKIVYEWEKAKFDRDYDRQQEFLYEEGSYEAYKGDKKIDSGLEYEDIRFEVYYEKELEQYYIFADFKNPNGENSVEDNVSLRKKDGAWKVDQDQSTEINRENIKKDFDRKACIHCE